MSAELSRLLLGMFPYVLGTTLAAIILWSDNVRIYLPQLILYSILAAIAQTATYRIEIESLRVTIELTACFLLALAVFKAPVKWIAKVYVTSCILGYLAGALAVIVAISLFKNTYARFDIPIIWITICIPMYVLLVYVAYLIKQRKIPGLKLIYGIQASFANHYLIYLAVLIQMLIFYSLAMQMTLKNYNTEYIKTALIFLGISIPFAFSIFLILKFIQNNARGIRISTQNEISENIMELVNSVRGQRHDFLNHLQILNFLIKQQEWNALNEYLTKLLKEVTEYNDILKLDNPIIAALVNSKVSQANRKGVTIKSDISASFADFAAYSMDIARILGNLIDNAIDVVVQNEEKELNLEILEKGSSLVCSVSNQYFGSLQILNNLFEPEFTTKGDSHKGIGLYVSKQLAKKLNGTLQYHLAPQDNTITFTLTVPGFNK